MTATVGAQPGQATTDDSGNKVGFWVARNWQGMTMPIWLRLLARHRFAIAPSRLPMALRIGFFALCNSGLGLWEKIQFNEQIKSTEIRPPLFVIGHWRTGTTWLHELLAQDDRFNYPTTYQCMAPHHFLETRDYAPDLMPHLLEKRRPMDNMEVGWDRPQEDEFALANLGAPSPYLSWAFSNQPRQYEAYLELQNIPAYEKKRWQQILVRFLKRIACKDDRRIVLKSPTHTARIATLLEIFPDAQFVHIVRNPYVVFPSTVRTWKRLWDMMGMETPRFEDVNDYVFDTLPRMYYYFNKDKGLLKVNQLCEVRYEDLRDDIMGEMHRIYDHLQLGGFDAVAPKLKKYVEEKKDYKTNKFEISDDLKRKIDERWGFYFEQYGYDKN